jgi:hypothetical protein
MDNEIEDVVAEHIRTCYPIVESKSRIRNSRVLLRVNLLNRASRVLSA